MSDVFTDFICIHGEEEERANEVLGWALTDLKASADNLLSGVVYGLEWDIGESAYITGMYCDQWAKVTAETYKKDEEGKPVFRTSIQCDTLEHGIAATWKAFKEKFPPEEGV